MNLGFYPSCNEKSVEVFEQGDATAGSCFGIPLSNNTLCSDENVFYSI